MTQVKLPDGSILQVDKCITSRQLAEQIGPGLANAAVAAKIDGKVQEGIY